MQRFRVATNQPGAGATRAPAVENDTALYEKL